MPKPPNVPFSRSETVGPEGAARQRRPRRPLFINISNNGIEIAPPQRENGPKKANEVLTLGPAAEPLAAKEKSVSVLLTSSRRAAGEVAEWRRCKT
jgi:hypothetical protein